VALRPVGAIEHRLYVSARGSGRQGAGVAQPDVPAGAIHTIDLNGPTPRVAYTMPQPGASFLALGGGRVFAVSELPVGHVYSYDRQGAQLVSVGSSVTGGIEPCHIAVRGRELLIAHYGCGTVSRWRVRDGRFGPSGSYRPPAMPDLPVTGATEPVPRAHQVQPIPTGGWMSSDIGTDRLHEYRVDRDHRMLRRSTECILPAGTGPRHFSFLSPDAALVVGERDCRLHLVVRSDSSWRWVRAWDLPAAACSPTGKPSHIELSADGSTVYVATRGPDVLSVFSIDGSRAHPRLDLRQQVSTGGKWPRHFALGERHIYIANQDSGDVAVFARDPATGRVGDQIHRIDVVGPTCVVLASDDRS
jgi:6-phosphogluconolactonase